MKIKTNLVVTIIVVVLLAALNPLIASAPAVQPRPYALLNPPKDITPAQTREAFPWSFPEPNNPSLTARQRLPRKVWTPEERTVYEKRVDWFHKAKYGIFFHFLSGGKWTTETWNKWVEDVDVERVADQAKEIGAGYVAITLGQNQIYSCAPNPVIDRHWGQGFTSKRDLPADLANALEKRGIVMILYIATDNQYKMPRPASLQGNARYDKWIEVAQWYSDHYGNKCKAWWVDGLCDFTDGYCINIHKALKHGNPDALVCSGQYEISDMLHGHCQSNWNHQKAVVKPFFGRWDPDFNIQWHVFQYIGSTWGAPGCNKPKEEIVKYAADIVRGGGVITFDLGTFSQGCFYMPPVGMSNGLKPDGTRIGPFLEIRPDQFEILKAVHTELKDIPVSDGKGGSARS
jgi:hypothetical protein